MASSRAILQYTRHEMHKVLQYKMKASQQNMQLAQTNGQMFAELCMIRGKLKLLQYDYNQMSAMYKVKTTEVEQKVSDLSKQLQDKHQIGTKVRSVQSVRNLGSPWAGMEAERQLLSLRQQPLYLRQRHPKESDIELAKELVVQDKVHKKILELQVLVETDTLEGRFEGKFRTIDVKDFAPSQTYKYVVDVDPVSFERDEVKQEMNSAKTIFVNAVMGLMPHFWHGTSKMDEVIDKNRSAQKFFGGGDTLQTFKSLHPALYEAALNNVKYYLFTGGGTVLKVIEEGDPMGLETVKALIDNKANYSKSSQNN